MTETLPAGDMLPEERERQTQTLTSTSVARPASAGSETGAIATHEDPIAVSSHDMELTYEHGVEFKARSQYGYARMRFFRHRLAVASLVILAALCLVAIFAKFIAPYGEDEIPLYDTDYIQQLNRPPTFADWHLFGTDQLGRDYLSRVIFGLQTSLWVALVVALISTVIGTILGAISGYYGGHVDNALMRLVDLFLTVPGLAVLLVAAKYLGQGSVELPLIGVSLPQPAVIGLLLAFLFWTGIARIVRGLFLSLREKEFVEAAKAAGAGDLRIIGRHMLPNCVGPIVVNTTLIIAVAILVEAALSFLGFGIQPPESSIGKLIADGQQQGIQTWWLVTFPGLVIVLVCLCINFIGDGLRDALDPTQQRVRA
jgi:ABC-type dipeptide/oligopeptide/nickel transport system permease subunit